jgi:hypothetical protein
MNLSFAAEGEVSPLSNHGEGTHGNPRLAIESLPDSRFT